MSDHSPRKLPYELRARSLPHKHFFLASLYWAALLYIFSAATLASIVGFLLNSDKTSAYLMIGLVFSSLIIWLIGLLTRKKASCPLCKGTPFLDNQASKHIKAMKIFPLNYGTTNLLKALITRRIRCPYCGTPFDFLKDNLSNEKETR